METLRIALFDSSSNVGGGQLSLANLARALAERGHEVHVIWGLRQKDERAYNTCLQHCFIHEVPGCDSMLDRFRAKSAISRELFSLNKAIKFDVTNTNSMDGFLIPRELSDRLVITIHGNNIQRGLALLEYAGKNVEMRRAIASASINFFKTVFGHFLYGELERSSCAKAKLTIALTSTEAYYAQRFYSIPPQKIRIVPNIITSPIGNDFTELSLPRQKKIILSVGALGFIKGTPILAKAMEQVLKSSDDVLFVSVGNGALMNCLERLKTEFPTKVVIIPQASEDLASIYRCSSVYVNGSIYEAFALSIGEAMLAGKPVAAFRLASIPCQVKDNVTGYLAEPGCWWDLASKTLDLLDDEEKTRIMGLNAMKMTSELYSAAVIGSTIERVFKEV